MPLYFAFGSNMCSGRLAERVAIRGAGRRARLDGWALRCNKRSSKDHTAKANIVRDEGAHVWGVVFELEDGGLTTLDRIEHGYRRVDVSLSQPALDACATYSVVEEQWLTDDPRLRSWYRAHMVRGAREHALPSAWIAMLEELAIV